MNTIFRTAFYFATWLCVVIEIGSVSFLRTYFGIYGSPVIFIVSGILLTFLLLRIIQLKKTESKTEAKVSFLHHLLLFLCFAIVSFAGWLLLRSYFDHYPIDPGQSDIIPLIKVLVHRFSTGEQVYKEVNDFGYTMYPNYLPMTWLPFWLAEKLNLDYRTWAFGLFSACIFISVWMSKESLIKKLVLLILPFLVFLIYLWEQPFAFGWTVEPMITGFYLLLLYGLYKNSTFLVAAALICCLLSRYAIVLMIPFLFFVCFLFISKKRAWSVAGITLTGIILLFILPFLLGQPAVLSKGYQYYHQGALDEWRGQYWQQSGELPYQLSQGYGFAIFFYSRTDIEATLSSLQKTHIAVSVLVPLVLTGWYFLKGKRWLQPHIFLLLTTHLYLIFFFAFIQVPYSYLFFTPVVLSAFVTGLLTVYPVRK